MSLIQTSLLFAVCIAVVVSKKATPCTSPVQWEGRASEYDHLQGLNNRFLISFDGKNKMKRFIEERKSFMPGKRWYEYIQDYKKGIQYKINLSNNICTVDKMSGPWQNHTIPTNATMEDEYVMGDAGQGFNVREWSDRVPGRKKEAWIGAFTVKNCWPVFEVFTYNDPDSNYSVSTSTRFFDLTLGIQNMSVFTPPDICNTEYSDAETFVDEFVHEGGEDTNTDTTTKFLNLFKEMFNYFVKSDWGYERYI